MQQTLRQATIFGLIGLVNTVIDTTIYTVLVMQGLPTITAIVVSTSIGLICSFTLNSRYTFGDGSSLTSSMVVRFVILTLTGLWLLQPLVVIAATYAMSPGGLMGVVSIKLIATGVTMVWNFCWYRWFVFR